MRSLTCTRTEQLIQLTRRISLSGEGEIWETTHPTQLAKIYAVPSGDRIRKLETMIAFPPTDPNQTLNHVSFAWPTSLLRESSGTVVGFLMPKITDGLEIINVYNPKRRKHVLPGFNWLYLHTTALNIASLLWRLHDTGLVVGDIKPQNILVNSQALPSIIDTDSFQVRHPRTGEVFPCPVGSEGFTPRELLGKDLAAIQQNDIHDRFRLGIIIYLLLLGEHPFKGQWVGYGDSPEPNELVEKGFWPFGEDSLIHPSPSTLPLKAVHPLLQEGFIRCFSEGHDQPQQRPTAQEWVMRLTAATEALKGCRADRRHYYSATYGRCIWCDRRKKLGVDVFNPEEEILPTKTQVSLPETTTQRSSQAGASTVPKSSSRGPLPASQMPPGQTRPPQSPLPSPTPSGSSSDSLLQTLINGFVGSEVGQWMRSPNLRTAPAGVKVTGGMVFLLGLFVLLIRVSSFEMTPDEVAMSLVGAIACLGLVLIGFLWIKLLKKMGALD